MSTVPRKCLCTVLRIQRRLAVACAVALFYITSPAVTLGGTVYVEKGNVQCNDNGDGSASTPFCSIKPAVDSFASGPSPRPGGTVIVRPGMYDGSNDRGVYISDSTGPVSIICEPLPSCSENCECAIDCNSLSRAIRVYLYDPDAGPVLIEGLEITNGRAFGSGGGGIFIEDGSATIRNVTITNCFAEWSGGGIAAYTGHTVIEASTVQGCGTSGFETGVPVWPTSGTGGGIFMGSGGVISDCTILDNGAYSGGGVYIAAEEQETEIRGTLIQGNSATDGIESAAGHGGGIAIDGHRQEADPLMPVRIVDCTITANDSGGEGGGVGIYGNVDLSVIGSEVSDNVVHRDFGGGIGTLETVGYHVTLTIEGSRIVGNQASLGAGGIYINKSYPNADSARLKLKIYNSLIADGSSGYFSADKGGGIYAGTMTEFEVVNATIANNTASQGGGIYVSAKDEETFEARITNSILWGNQAENDVGPQILAYGYAPVRIERSDVQNATLGLKQVNLDGFFVVAARDS